MTAFLLSIHVLVAILTVGPVTVAASMFPPAARAATAAPDNHSRAAVIGVLYRITRVYAVVGIAVPVFGLATGAALGVLGQLWLIVSMILTAAAAVILGGVIVPHQRQFVVEASSESADSEQSAHYVRRLAMYTGIFNLLWAAVVVLMICRPGSTTGVGL